MRIDFAASYKEVSKLLKASSQPASPTDNAAFEQDLNGLLSQPAETLGDLSEPKPAAALQSSTGDSMRAMLRLDGLGPEEPSMSSAESPINLISPELVPSESVKTPTLVEAKRIQVEKVEVVQEKVPQLGGEEIRARLRLMSEKAGVNPALSMAVVKAESSFNTTAVSRDGHASKGLFQLLDTTGKFLMAREGDESLKYDPFDPELNMKLGTSYLKYLHEIFSDSTELPNNLKTRKAADDTSLEKFAVAAFNAGEGRVASAQHRSERAGRDPSQYDHVAPFLPRSTREYVSRVVSGKKLF